MNVSSESCRQEQRGRNLPCCSTCYMLLPALQAESPSWGCHSPPENPFIKITRNNKLETKINLGITDCHELNITDVLASIDY